ncbi:eukaryotic translation initiation factor SUI1 family protein [Guyanagaster necrorhizus]|uniref:Eukaryotic translation initiation factor SUI1 family protein n=1 Tax=Guyanagaster necrorhizus TaxID=856835 RepID=A0A9P7W4M5_9AGAR|nr:eukaryotic translation initiation factor SUI1 family protein [Guyanagaster necrorhizus MCA 3950]KAG7452039.1 eukaryotic translation initiation factor SUI1 family protein [Guyanagaster necrorhizus MCA 3950]
MFKKPLGGFKNSAPIRSSDRRKLKQRVLTAFSVPPEDGDLLVPEGILTAKFSTHLGLPGVAYLSSDGDPLWMTLGKGSDELIPTIYTLWKKPQLLPFICTPAAVIPILVGGADLMIPGVIYHSSSLAEGQLVAVCQFERRDNVPTMSAPLAIGRMAVSSDQLQEGGKEKGKAALIIHAWKDHLWDMGSKRDLAEPIPIGMSNTDIKEEDNEQSPEPEQSVPLIDGPPPSEPHLQEATYTREEVSMLLHMSLLQAVETTLKSLPPSSFPIPLSTFHTTYILPYRPAFPALVLSPSTCPNGEPNPEDVTIKASTHKSFTAFLKVAEKASLLATKAPQKHAQQNEAVVTAVNGSHPSVQQHKPFVTLRDLELKAARKAQREEEEQEREALAHHELNVRELWKPHLASAELFKVMGASTSDLYSIPEIRALLNNYITSKDIVNQYDQAYINLDDLLRSCVVAKAPSSKKGKEPEPQQSHDFMRRNDLYKKVLERMQSWYEIRAEGKDLVVKKGNLVPIHVATKIRQGRKASTFITGFEPFLINADEMADELRKTCAGATSVTPIQGKGANAGSEVLVQGKQSKAVTDYLVGKGVPKRWIEVKEAAGKK